MTDGFKLLGPDEGEALWSAGSLMVVKATTDDTHGGMTVIEQTCPAGLDSPGHVHDEEEQCLFMLAGTVELRCGDTTSSLAPGSFVVLPRGVPHSFVVGPEGARFLSLTTPAGFETFARAIGSPAEALTPPPIPEIDSATANVAWDSYNGDASTA